MVSLSADNLPKDKPRYTMGVGFALDLVVCSALGSDMYDCVYPTRTAVRVSDSFYKSRGQSFLDDNFVTLLRSCPPST